MKQQQRHGTTLTMEPPKHNDDFERGIIKFCLSPVGGMLPFVLKRLKPEYFYNDTYRDCFRAICDMVNGTYGVRVDPDEITFAQYAYNNDGRYTTFRQMSERESVKSLQTFTLFAFDICSNTEFKYTNLEYAVTEIIEMYKRRRRYELAIQLQNMTGEWFENDETARKIYDQLMELETLGNEVCDDVLTPVTLSGTSLVLSHQDDGFSTGYKLGKKQGAKTIEREFKIPPKQITVIAAATGHGKTTFCYNLALRLIRNNKRPDGTPIKVIYLTYEEPAHNIVPKIINVMAGVNLAEDNRAAIVHDIANGGTGETMQSELKGYYIDALNEFFQMASAGTLNVKYCDLDAYDLCNLLRDIRRRDAADVVIIDYVQLIEKESSKARGRSRSDELKDICADLRHVATDENFGLPIILASQFNRDVQKSNDPRTMDKTNLGESSNIEHVANVILGLWNCQETNAEKYLATDKDGNPTGKLSADGERLLLFQHTKHIDDPFIYARLLKSRDGVSGLNMTLNYYGNCGRIDNTGDPSPTERATGKRDELTEPYNTLYKRMEKAKPAPAAETRTAIDDPNQLPF